MLLAAAALAELGRARAREPPAADAPADDRGRRLARAALRLGLPERLRRSGLQARFPLGAVLAAKLASAAAGALLALAAAPAAPGRLSLVVAVALPAAGFFAPDALLEREARRRRRRLLGALPDALDLLAVSAGSGHGPAAGLEQVARAGEGPLAEELGVLAAELACGAPLAGALRELRRRVPAARSPPWSRRSNARAASARRWPSSCAARPAPCAATTAARSRSGPPARRRRSSSSSPSSSSPRSC